jgi:hypothetical protein
MLKMHRRLIGKKMTGMRTITLMMIRDDGNHPPGAGINEILRVLANLFEAGKLNSSKPTLSYGGKFTGFLPP